MSMFDNYENNSYPAYNLTTPKKINSVKTNFKTPLYITDKHNNINRFYWVEGEQFNLKIQASQEINIPNESIIFYGSEKPNNKMVGFIGQKCYNLSKYISWTCIKAENENYTWEQDSLFEYLPTGGEKVILSPPMFNKKLKVNILNFRRETIYEYEIENESLISIPINEESTPDLRQGQYFIDLFVIDEITHFIKEYDVTILGKLDRLKYSNMSDKTYVFDYSIQKKDNNIVWIPIDKEDGKGNVWYPIEDSKEYELQWYSLDDVVHADISAVISNKWSNIK